MFSCGGAKSLVGVGSLISKRTVGSVGGMLIQGGSNFIYYFTIISYFKKALTEQFFYVRTSFDCRQRSRRECDLHDYNIEKEWPFVTFHIWQIEKIISFSCQSFSKMSNFEAAPRVSFLPRTIPPPKNSFLQIRPPGFI